MRRKATIQATEPRPLQPIDEAEASRLLDELARVNALCDRLHAIGCALRQRLDDERPYWDREAANDTTRTLEARWNIVAKRHSRFSGRSATIQGTLATTTARDRLIAFHDAARAARRTAPAK